MGYDCYVRPLDPAADPRPAWYWTVPEAEQDAAREAMEEWDSRNYFRRNIWGVTHLIDALIEMDMGFDPAAYGQRHPDFPDADEYGVTWDDEGDPVGARAADYRKALDEVLAWHGVSDIPGIPVHKFGSNDGWHVTNLECIAALGIYDAKRAEAEPHPEAFADDFIPFLRAAAKADGFEVR